MQVEADSCGEGSVSQVRRGRRRRPTMATRNGPRVDETGHPAESTGRAGFLLTGRILLVCGILAPVLYVVANDVVAAGLFPGYDRIARPVSELSATYAP